LPANSLNSLGNYGLLNLFTQTNAIWLNYDNMNKSKNIKKMNYDRDDFKNSSKKLDPA